MKWSYVWMPLLALAACKGDGGDTDELPVIDFRSSAPALAASGGVDEVIAHADRAVNAVLAMAALVTADDQAQDKLLIDNGPAEQQPSDPGPARCWERPNVTQSQFTIHYDGFGTANCGAVIDTKGRVSVNIRPPNGPVVYEEINLDLLDRLLGGALAFVKGPSPTLLTWSALNIDSDGPYPGARPPIEVFVAGAGTLEVTFDGGAALSYGPPAWRMWGVASVAHPSGETVEVRVGGVDAGALTQPVAPEGAAVSSLDFQACRCPLEGLVAYDVELEIDRVEVALDALKVQDDGVSDPVLQLPVAARVEGLALAERVDCGEYEITFTPQAPEVQVTVEAAVVEAEIERLCGNRTISDEDRCTALKEAARDAGELTVELPEEVVGAAAQDAMLATLDGGWCKY